MTTEDDFQAALDANPADHHTRMVFADWLQDRADERAEGYRALGALRRAPIVRGGFTFGGVPNSILWWWESAGGEPVEYVPHRLPQDWLRHMDMKETRGMFYPSAGLIDRPNTRREVEDAAALAFARLSHARRMQLLALTPEEAPR